MTVPARKPSTDVVLIPSTGEMIPADDLPAVAIALDEIRALEQKLVVAKRVLTGILAAEAERVGTGTIDLPGGVRVEVTRSVAITWDVKKLAGLLKAGLPQERYDALVRREEVVKVSAAEANRIAKSNAKYATIVRRARTDSPASVSATVRR